MSDSMKCALAFLLSIQLMTGPDVLLQPATVEFPPGRSGDGDQPAKISMISQNIPPESGQKSEQSSDSARDSSPEIPSKQPASNTSAISTPHKKSSSSRPPQKTKGQKTKTTKKIVVRNGSTAEPTVQFSIAGSPEQTSHERRKTDGLLAETNSNIQKLAGRSLNSGQQDMLTQIRSYMQQAKSAEATGDLQSAQNLALKAHLLSSDLAGK